MKQALCIGEDSDPHVVAVSEALDACGARLLVLDADSIRSGDLSVLDGRPRLSRGGGSEDLAELDGAWLRRTVRANWGDGLTYGSVEAVELGAWVALLRVITRAISLNWITSPAALWRAEEKVVQEMAARELGIRYPRTLVTASVKVLREVFDEPVVVKPIGGGQFLTPEGEARTFFAQTVDPADDRVLSGLDRAPFIFQQYISAEWHYRVVTVGEHVWCARLDAEGLPVDWRESQLAHSSFSTIQQPGLGMKATRVAAYLGLGYSSQDWVQDNAQVFWLLDVNPSGQWLFLPSPIADEVSAEMARHLIRSAS